MVIVFHLPNTKRDSLERRIQAVLFAMKGVEPFLKEHQTLAFHCKQKSGWFQSTYTIKLSGSSHLVKALARVIEQWTF